MLSHLESPYEIFFPIESLEFCFSISISNLECMHVLFILTLERIDKYFWSYALTRWHTYYDSHYLTNRLTSRPKVIGS